MSGPNFLLTGAAGYIAPRHYEAIRSVGGNLLAVLDPHDSVGVLDRYGFPQAQYFREFERFERHALHLIDEGATMDYVSICSPNYLHDAHCRFAHRIGATAICEKPLCIEPWNVERLIELGADIRCILQMRLHPEAARFHEAIQRPWRHSIVVEYVTPRGEWYLRTWKAEDEKSGGLMMNLGVHLFDLLCWACGTPLFVRLWDLTQRSAAGVLEFGQADVTWRLSIDWDRPPSRVVTVDGERFDFTSGFTDLHTESYRRIVSGDGFTATDALPAIRLVHELRRQA